MEDIALTVFLLEFLKAILWNHQYAVLWQYFLKLLYFVAQIEEQTSIVSGTGKEYEIEPIADGVVPVLYPDVVINCRRRIKLDDLYQAYLALVVKQLSTSKVRRYVKTGAAEVTALLMNVFGYKVLEDAPCEIVKGMAIEDRLVVMV